MKGKKISCTAVVGGYDDVYGDSGCSGGKQ